MTKLETLRSIVALLICTSVGSAQVDEPNQVDDADTDEIVISQAEGEALIVKLGAATFAEREQAVGEILRLGMPMVPLLRKAVEKGDDPELVLRAKATLGQLTSGDFETRVANFLSGRGDGNAFEGWQTVEATLGDSPATRDLFIQILRVHPDLIASLDGTTRDRTVAVEQAAQLIQANIFQNHIFPTLADGVALLLPLTDRGVAISGGYEATLVRVMITQVATLQKDASLWPPVSTLLNEWVSRSRIENRKDVLWHSMQWDLYASATLGIRTLNETTDLETLQTAMQAIARFGAQPDAQVLARFIDDNRLAATQLPIVDGGQSLRVTVGDSAMAAIAVLYKVPLTDISMKQGELHPKVGFLIDNAGYFPNQTEDRARAVKTVRGWLSGEQPPGKPRS